MEISGIPALILNPDHHTGWLFEGGAYLKNDIQGRENVIIRFTRT